MEPTIPYGAMVEVVPWEQEMIEVGQVVTWACGQIWNTHRIRRIRSSCDGDLILTRGDALYHDDPPIAPSHLLGVVKRVHYQGQSWDVASSKAQARAYQQWYCASMRANIRSLFR